ncbi:MAG: flavodoxin [Gammaproteobacteria bacterium]|nr:flavodoxin [Gammaproteobacteria bacterium]
MAEAVMIGTKHPDITGVKVRFVTAQEADAKDLIWADGLILGTPENFGYMSGMMKDFFERTFYEVEGKISPLPFAMFISAENDGTGAELSIERIAKGYPLIKVQPSIINTGELTSATVLKCEELGTSMAAGLEMSLF